MFAELAESHVCSQRDDQSQNRPVAMIYIYMHTFISVCARACVGATIKP